MTSDDLKETININLLEYNSLLNRVSVLEKEVKSLRGLVFMGMKKKK